MINNIESEYLSLLVQLIRKPGEYRKDRTGTGTKAVFGRQIRANLQEGFPLLTTKKVSFKNVLVELLWFLSGNTNVRWLQENNCTIWDEWADSNGDLGRVYGAQWRKWQNSRGETVDQIDEAVRLLKVDPYSRRNIVCAWNPGELKQMALTPCHALFQFFVEDGKLSCQLYQRSPI